jgi:hypothetical protein
MVANLSLDQALMKARFYVKNDNVSRSITEDISKLKEINKL